MNNQKGIAHLLLLVVILLVFVLGGFFILSSLGIIKLPSFFNKLPILNSKKPVVELKTEYKNPFNKETQYVNPFDEYKNPFVVSR